MSQLRFNYCPFCGSHIPNSTMAMVNYCPFCGGNLLLSDSTNQIFQYDDNTIVQKDLALKQLAVDNDERNETNFDVYNKTNLEKILAFEYYSIVLKDAPNKQSLVRKLEKVLLRGYFAIRLAVDHMPSLIIYKAKGDDITYLNELLIEEQASTSMIAGDFNHNPVVEEVFEMFDQLNAQTQQTIKQIPRKLWMGDRIHGVFPNNYRENSKGVLIIADKNIYFLPDEVCDLIPKWFVRSYNVLSKVVMQDNCLEFTYKDAGVASIAFVDKKKLLDAYHCIHDAIQISNE
ncbi:MAG: zinc ribbon domain-containing protein [Sporomusaceae bacterium]|nr:zinc ribbon domain-containing protein [Sporomusaceae bacterium]